MIHITKTTRIPSVEETLGTLRLHNNLMPQFVDFDKIMMNISYLQMQIENISKPLFDVIGKPPKSDASGNMKVWIAKNSDPTLFDTTKEGISLNAESIAGAIETGQLSENACTTLLAYQEYASKVRMRGTLISLLQNPISDVPSCDGHRMLIIRPEWEFQNTFRVAMRKPAIQNLHRALQEVQTVPEGYVLLHTDSGQVEPKIVYSHYIYDAQIRSLIMAYNDAYYGVLHYIQLPDSVIASGTTEFTPNEITDAMADGRKKLKTMNNAVMYGSKSNPSGDIIKAALIKRIGEHPARLELISRLTKEINTGQRIFKTAFGTPIDISKSPKLFGGARGHAESLTDELLKLAINNPIQGTAADLMRLSVYEANKLITAKSKKSYIVNYVHDAGMFAIHEDDYDAIADELADIVAYDVEGWLPIYAEPEFGRDGGKRGLIEDLY